MNLSDYNRYAEKLQAPPQYRGTVVSVHGINTRGSWQKHISPLLQDAGLRHIPLDYGYMLIGFLWAHNWVERQIVDAVFEQRDKAPNVPHGVIAHSFGTFCLGQALKHNPSLRVGRISLFGSILPTNYPWQTVRGQYQSVLNEACARDRVVKCADRCFWWRGAGASGCHGFSEGGPAVYNRHYPWTGHSRLATRSHCQEVWLPYLLSGTLPPARARSGV